jgi:hypothetical protein
MRQSSRDLVPRGFLVSGRADIGSPRSLDRPFQRGCGGEADKGRECIDREIFNLACLPGAQICRISMVPIITSEIAEVSSRCRE